MIIPILRPLKFVKTAIESTLSKTLSKPQICNFTWLLTAVILGQRFNLSHIEKILLKRKSDNAFSWFLSHSKLNPGVIWQEILNFAGKSFKVMGRAGKFIIDDTFEKHSKFCRFIHGVTKLYDHATGRYVRGKCYVFLYFVINDKIRFPIGWKTYIPKQKTKHTLALELIEEALSRGFRCSCVLFDSWFAVSPFLDALHQKGLIYVCELKRNNKIWITDEKKSFKASLEKFFTYCSFLTKKTIFGITKGQSKSKVKSKYETEQVTCSLCALNHNTALVKSKISGTNKLKYLITNDLRLEAQSILEIYSLRWLIEEFFGDVKKLLDFEGARVRNDQAGAVKVLTLSCADLLLSLEIFRHSQQDSQSRAITVSSMIAKIQKENIEILLEALKNPEEGEDIATKWMEILKADSSRYRRNKKTLCKLSEQDPEEELMSG